MNLAIIKHIVNSGARDWEIRLLDEVDKFQQEDLNIDRKTRDYVIKALNRTDRYDDAAHLLGVSKRTLYRYLGQFNICRHRDRREFFFIERIPKHETKNKAHKDQAQIGGHKGHQEVRMVAKAGAG